MADEDPTAFGTQGVKLPKCPEKALLLEKICKLFKPITDISYRCPRLLGHLKNIEDWRDMQWLCVASIQQDPSKPRYVDPAQRVPVNHDSGNNQPSHPAPQALPKAPCSTQPVIQSVGSSGLEAPSPSPGQETVLAKSQTKMADQAASSSNQAATIPAGDSKESAGNQPGFILPRDAPREPVFEADVRDPVQGQVKLRSSHLCEIWFCPKQEYHTYRLRTAMTEKDPFSRVSVQLLIGSNEYLNEHGKMPELGKNAGIPAVVPPDDEELEDPPGEWTTPEVLIGDAPEMLVHSERTVYVWLRRGTLWARSLLRRP